ncbi:MAG: biosynthetic-type acetolactate synthase large subunit [Bacteroidales bacterium]|nr:biosynthetic-type acetolactate synthase large subunit [Bacteroidales bacterium]MBD5257925.1 biosynthetic-type acetolactate synthase large subunit [Barnesiella sp.]
MSNMINGAEALIKSLICEGVDLVFGYPGGAIIPVYDKLYDYTSQLKHILVRHEQGATHAAQGYARATGKTGVVIVTSGPAATNVITGLSDALMDSTPLVVITGQVASSLLGSDAFQETDVVGIVHPVTKWAVQIRRAEDIPAAVARAFYIANNGRPGPVVLDIAKDAQVGMVDWHHEVCDYIRSYLPVPEINDADISEAARLLNHAERPMILSGHGVMIAEAEKELQMLAEKADIPVAATLLGLSTMPSDHPLYKGMLGMHGNIGPNYNTNRADVILAIGMRFDDRVTGRLDAYAPDAKIIHIDIDSSEFNKNVRAALTVHADAKQALEALLPKINQTRRTDWLDSFTPCEEVEMEKVIKPEVHPEEGLMKMGEVVDRVSRAFHDRAIGVTDVGQNQMFGSRYFRYTEPRSLLTSGGLGTMGFGLPAAIGAKMGCPDRQVVLFVGDGGFQMTIQELGTILEYGTAVKIVLLNNNFLGNVRQWQQLFFNGRFSQTPMINPDFVAIAAAYGIPAENVDDRSQLDAAIDRMVKSDTAYMLNVNIDPTDMIFPMIPLGAAVDEMIINANEKFELSN